MTPPKEADANELTVTFWQSVKAPAGVARDFTRAELVATLRDPKEAADKLTLPGFAMASFRDGYRNSDHLIKVCAVALDDDAGTRSVAAMAEILAPFAGFIYTSHSSTPEAPRTRPIIFTTRHMTPAEYPIVWRFVAGHVREHGVDLDEKTKDPTRLWFIPARKPGGMFEFAELGGELLDVDGVLAVMASTEEAPAVTPTTPQRPTVAASSVVIDPENEPAALRSIPQAEREAKALRYLSAIPVEKKEGGDGSSQLLRLAGTAVRGFACGIDGGARVLKQAPAGAAWTARELQRKCVDAMNGSPLPWGAKLVDELSIRFAEKDEAKAAATAKASTPSKAEPRRFKLISATELSRAVPSVPFVWRHFGIAPGRPSLLAGYGGVGKTFVAQCLGLHVAAGVGAVWGYPIARGGVVHFDFEMTQQPTQRRYQRIAHAHGLDLTTCDLALASMPGIYLSDRDAFEPLVEACRGRALGLVDNLAAATATSTAKENESSIRTYLDLLTRVSGETGCTFLVLVHERKAAKDEPGGLQRVRGSSAITDASGSVISVAAAEGDGVITLSHTKTSLRRKGEDLMLGIEDVGMPEHEDDEPQGLAVRRLEARPLSEKSAKTQAKIIELLSHGPQESKRKIERSLGLRSGEGSVEVEALLVRREIVKVPGKGFCLDTSVAREERIIAAVESGAFASVAQLAKAAHVDTDVVVAAMTQGLVVRNGDGRLMAVRR